MRWHPKIMVHNRPSSGLEQPVQTVALVRRVLAVEPQPCNLAGLQQHRRHQQRGGEHTGQRGDESLHRRIRPASIT